MKYSKALTVIRASKGLQQKDIAELLGVTPSYISRIEKDERPMTNSMIKTLCKSLKVPVELFMLLGQDRKNLGKEDAEIVDELGRKLLKIITES